MNDWKTTVLDHALLEQYAQALKRLQDTREYLGRLEQEIWRRMEERQATAIPNDTWVCEAKTRNTYPAASLTPLKEVFNADDLAACYTPAHQEVVDVPEKWNAHKVIPLARRYGAEALTIVEQAKMTERTGLKFHRKDNQPTSEAFTPRVDPPPG